MKKAAIILLSALIAFANVKAQVKIGNNPGTISQGSLLELESTSKALTLPRMTTVQMQAIPSPVNGMIIFNIDSNCIYLYKTNNVWASISSNVSAPATLWPYHSNDSTVGVRGNKKGIISLTGKGLLASGDYSHAEGFNSASSGIHSWSFGLTDTSSGSGSAAMGYQNTASGDYSFALGYKNITAYQSAMALGQENTDSGWASLAMGLKNKIYNLTSYSNALGYLNEIRGGSSNTIMGEANITKAGRANVSMGYANMLDTVYFSNAFGNGNDIYAGFSHFVGGENNTVKAGTANSIFGQNNFADGSYLGAMGKGNIVYNQSGVALGQDNRDSGYASITGGVSNTVRSGVQYSSSFGYSNLINAGSSNTAIGESNIIKSGRAVTAAGYANTIDSSNFSNTFGTSNDILKGNSHIAAGENNTIRSGNANSIFGQNNIADGSYLGAIGYNNSLFFQSGVALGQNNKDSGYASIAAGLGNIINAGVQYSSSFGYNNQLNAGASNMTIGESNIIKSGRSSTGIGFGNIIDSSNFSNTLGTANNILNGNSHIVAGENNTVKAGNANSIFGRNNFANGSYLGAIGKDNNVFYLSAVALGQGNKDSGYASLAAGINNTIRADVLYSNAIGYNNQVNSGSSNMAMGELNIIQSGRGNTLSGYNNTTAANYSSLFGVSNQVLTGSSHMAGGESNIIKSGSANSVFGINNIADGTNLGAIGSANSVYSQAAIALGQGNKDSGYASITGGLNNVIESNIQYSTSFGQNNLTTKNLSIPGTTAGSGTFSAGLNNINSGYGSVALGGNNRPTNVYSLSANYNTIANSHAMSAFGHFNDTIPALQGVSFEQEEMLFAIGNGSGNLSRRNSFTMLRNGFTSINTTNEPGPNTPRAELDVKGTGAIIVPVGTTAERPATPVVGMIRFCTDCPGGPVLQGFDGTTWVNL
ncbi:MAG: hypothetical protein ABI402_00565 [Ferruginibacter sp.]